MNFKKLSALFMEKFPQGAISQTWASTPSLGIVEEQPSKLIFEKDGVASYRAIRYSFSEKKYLTIMSNSKFAEAMGVQDES